MKFLKILIVNIILLTSLQLFSQQQEPVKIHWMDFSTAVEKQKEVPKPIFIDMYTEWCGWCKKLDASTFENSSIITYLNNNYYPVKFDAETHDTINYKGRDYVNKNSTKRSTHELALELMDNKPSYPSIIYIDDKSKANRTAGYMDAKKLEPLLIFFAERIYYTTNYNIYNEAFCSLYRPEDSVNIDHSGNINWLTIQEAVLEQTKEPKKLLIYFYSDYFQNVSSHLMTEITLKNPKISKYINENYYPIIIPASTTDTIRMFNKVFVNDQKSPGYPHQFVISLLQNHMIFPSIIFFNEQNEMLSPLQGYFAPNIIEPYIHFVSENAFKDQKWKTYYENFIKSSN
jgi:thioredoxin-related protein